MAIEALEAPQVVEGAGPERWKWTGEEFQRLGEAGMFPAEARLELMDGEIIRLMPPNPLHAATVSWIAKLLEKSVAGESYTVRDEKPVRLGPYFDPQPDVAIVRGSDRDYRARFPTPEDILLVVEVAESSLDYDRRAKLEAYAAAGISEYWIVNLRDDQLEVFRCPSGPAYTQAQVYRDGEDVPLPVNPSVTIPIAALLGTDSPAA